jgi:hypothetical protein
MARSGRQADEKLREIVARVIDTRRNTPRISPTWVANEAMFDLDRTREVERRFVLIWIGCNLELRSEEFEEPEYVLRDIMSDGDVKYNVARLRAEASAKNQHADALEAWHRGRR